MLALVIPVAAEALSVEASGRVVNDWSGEPLVARITYGARFTDSGEDGTWSLGRLPRDARLRASKTSFGDHSFAVGESEVRLAPTRLDVDIKDAATGQGIASAEVRHDDRLLGRSNESGTAFVSHPGKDETLLFCAASYQTKELVLNVTDAEVKLDPGGSGCPPLPTPTPAPTPSPSPSPSPTASPTPSPTGSP